MIEKEYAINKIEESINKIDEIWDDIYFSDTKKIKESWDNSLSEFYLDEFKKTNNTISLINSKLKVLKECWQKYNSDGAKNEDLR